VGIALFFIMLMPLNAYAAPASTAADGMIDAGDFGFSPGNTGLQNIQAMQRALDVGGTINISKPGTYAVAGTMYIGSHASLKFGDGVFLKKVNQQGEFSHVFLNKGALSRTYDEHISIDGLNLIVNGVDIRKFEVFGLHGQIAFFYVKDLTISHFRCEDLGAKQYCIQVCTFEDLAIHDVIIKGNKDGIHLGRGKRFHISDAVLQTFDDAIALNGHDYDVGNPELGWIEDGVIERCRDVDAPKTTGYFCRILAGAWVDWYPGMEVQKSDTVVSNGRMYRVQAAPDGKVYKSLTQPTHLSGTQVLDGITWGMEQTDVTHTAGVRNVLFRDISLEKPRVAFSIHFDHDKYSRSYYPGAQTPLQQGIVLENVRVVYDKKVDYLDIGTPIDLVTMRNCNLRHNRIAFHATPGMTDYLPTRIDLIGCVFNSAGPMDLLENRVEGKQIVLHAEGSMTPQNGFVAHVAAGPGHVEVDSDLPGLAVASTQPSK
jgi:hypothetical protein